MAPNWQLVSGNALIKTFRIFVLIKMYLKRIFILINMYFCIIFKWINAYVQGVDYHFEKMERG